MSSGRRCSRVIATGSRCFPLTTSGSGSPDAVQRETVWKRGLVVAPRPRSRRRLLRAVPQRGGTHAHYQAPGRWLRELLGRQEGVPPVRLPDAHANLRPNASPPPRLPTPRRPPPPPAVRTDCTFRAEVIRACLLALLARGPLRLPPARGRGRSPGTGPRRTALVHTRCPETRA